MKMHRIKFWLDRDESLLYYLREQELLGAKEVLLSPRQVKIMKQIEAKYNKLQNELDDLWRGND